MNLTIFTHVPKCAGTAINVAVSRALRPEQCLLVNRKTTAELLDRGIDPRLRYIGGHITLAQALQLASDATFIGAVRHPVKRVLSNYLMRIRDAPLDDDIRADPRGAGFRRFYRDRITSRKLDNLACRYFAGKSDANLAIAAIRDHYRIVWSNPERAWPIVAALLGIENPSPLPLKNAGQTGDNILAGEVPRDYFSLLSEPDLHTLESSETQDAILFDWLKQQPNEMHLG